ncbi:hypothetical protein ILUMI_21728 [Ignelater luminosus]|uniref:Uncharacterized protein n=1 Tax=Ignelater luminosus TaxID=2038154 RepID=A0A8K0G3F9_IGNLU|nr:hypothetical protein ILUMI_21728 [Ignelater luminosus]
MAFCFQTKVTISQVTLLSLVVLMGGYFFSPCYGIPVKIETSNDEPWWCQPCSQEHKTRHSRGINEPLKTQLSAAIGNYDGEISKYVNLLDSKLQIAKAKGQIKKNNWLPRKKFFRKLRKDNYEILPELHKNIQIYAVTFQRLQDMEIRTEDSSFDATYRTKILTRVKADIDLLRCEIEDEITNKQLPAPEKVPADFVDKHIPSAVDQLADGLIRDYSILKDYANFIKKCFTKLIGKANKKNRKNKKNKVEKQKNKPKRTPKNDLHQKSEQS